MGIAGFIDTVHKLWGVIFLSGICLLLCVSAVAPIPVTTPEETGTSNHERVRRDLMLNLKVITRHMTLKFNDSLKDYVCMHNDYGRIFWKELANGKSSSII